jgi:hypothetical protein
MRDLFRGTSKEGKTELRSEASDHSKSKGCPVKNIKQQESSFGPKLSLPLMLALLSWESESDTLCISFVLLVHLVPRRSLGTFELDGLEDAEREEEAGLVGDQIQGTSGRMWARAERRCEAILRNRHAYLP